MLLEGISLLCVYNPSSLMSLLLPVCLSHFVCGQLELSNWTPHAHRSLYIYNVIIFYDIEQVNRLLYVHLFSNVIIVYNMQFYVQQLFYIDFIETLQMDIHRITITREKYHPNNWYYVHKTYIHISHNNLTCVSSIGYLDKTYRNNFHTILAIIFFCFYTES